MSESAQARVALVEAPATAARRPLALSLARVHPLLPILVLAAALRLWGLSSMPVLYFDSGAYLGEGHFLQSAALRAADAVIHPAPGAPTNPLQRVVQAVQDGTAGHPPDLAKPGHAILLAIAMLLLGTSTFVAGGAVSAIAGIGTVAATYALGALGWGRRVGIVAALLLAISGQHLVYSREPLVESDGLVFATLAGLVYLRQVLQPRGGSFRGLLLVGLLVGTSFACNNRYTFWPASLGIVELLLWRQRGWRSWQPTVLRGVALLVGFVIPLSVIEGAYLVATAIGHAYGATMDWVDYPHQIVNFYRMNPPSRLRFDQWPTYFSDVAFMEGLPVLALLVLGVIILLVRRSWTRADVLLASSLLVPLFLFTVYSSGEIRMRNFSLALPWLMLTVGLGLWWVADHLRYPRAAAVVILAAIGLLAVQRDVALVDAPSAMPDLLATLRQGGITRVASTNGPVLSFFLGEANTNARLRAAFIDTPEDLDALAREYPYVEVDMQAYWSPGLVTPYYDRATPLFDEPNGNATWYLAFLLESQGQTWGGWNDVLGEWYQYRDNASHMRLFRSSDVAPHPPS